VVEYSSAYHVINLHTTVSCRSGARAAFKSRVVLALADRTVRCSRIVGVKSSTEVK